MSDIDEHSIARPFSDRGEAKFFHGREQHINFVRHMLDDVTHSRRRGTAVVFQGPPGAGKTALLYRLRDEAESAGWWCVDIFPDALISPATMAQTLGKTYIESKNQSMGGDALFDRAEPGQTRAGTQTVVGVLQDCVNSKERLLLILDEAQRLGNPLSQEQSMSVGNAMNALVNGTTNRNIVIVLGGLSHTQSALRKRGISRLQDDCVRNLERVRDQTAHQVLSDWLGELGCDERHKSTWERTLWKLADNYPQHLMICIRAVRDYLDAHWSEPTPRALHTVRQSVEQRKHAFYCLRSSDIPEEALALLGMFVGATGGTREFSHDQLIDVLRARGSSASPGASECLTAMIEQGVISKRLTGKLHVPIPSMSHYLMQRAMDMAAETPGTAQRFWQQVCQQALADYGFVNSDYQRRIEAHVGGPDRKWQLPGADIDAIEEMGR